MQKSSSEALQKSTRKGVMLLTKLILVVLSDKSSYYSSFSRIIKKVGAPASCSSCKATRTTVETGITTKKMQFKAFNAPAVMSLIKGMRRVGCFSLHYVVRLLQVQD